MRRRLDKLAAQVEGNSNHRSDQITSVLDEVDAVAARLNSVEAELRQVVERIDRMAAFLNQLKEERDKQ